MKSRRRRRLAPRRSSSLAIRSPSKRPCGPPYDAPVVGARVVAGRRYDGRGVARWVAPTLVLAVSCAGARSPSQTPIPSPARSAAAQVMLPTLPANALPGYVVHDTSPAAAALSTDALDPASLAA